MLKIQDKKTRKIYNLIFLSLLLLFNPNVNVVDILPDFIAYFIIYRLLEKAADSAAYFEEARIAFLRLGYVTLSKIPAFLLIALIRMGNSNDTDVFALVTVCYAALELIFLLPAIKNLFLALFHLGERTNAASLIKPIRLFKSFKVSPEFLRNISYIFVLCKSLFFFIPELFILSSSTDVGILSTPLARYYSTAVYIAQFLGILIGIFWLTVATKYLRAAALEGEFDNALNFLQTEEGLERYKTRAKVRRLKGALTALAAASFFSIELVFSNFEEINLLPHFIYGLVMLYALKKLYIHERPHKGVYVLGFTYVASAFAFYAFSFRFLDNYDYRDLLTSEEAIAAYNPLLILSVVEFVALTLFLIAAAFSLKGFVKLNTGLIAPKNESYERHRRDYHRSIMKQIYVLFSIGILSSLSKCLNVFINKDVKLVLTHPGTVSSTTYVASGIPWFNMVVFTLSAIYIGYSLYFTSTLKDEIEMKYDISK